MSFYAPHAVRAIIHTHAHTHTRTHTHTHTRTHTHTQLLYYEPCQKVIDVVLSPPCRQGHHTHTRTHTHTHAHTVFVLRTVSEGNRCRFMPPMLSGPSHTHKHTHTSAHTKLLYYAPCQKVLNVVLCPPCRQGHHTHTHTHTHTRTHTHTQLLYYEPCQKVIDVVFSPPCRQDHHTHTNTHTAFVLRTVSEGTRCRFMPPMPSGPSRTSEGFDVLALLLRPRLFDTPLLACGVCKLCACVCV